jgi:diadenosine tetraphosphate (Ap4A) HIT family hydrolase
MTRRTDHITSTYEGSFGSLSVARGTGRSGNSLWSWDALQECSAEGCPASPSCQYLRKAQERNEEMEKCRVMANYLKSVSTTILGNYENQMDEGQLFRVGMHIIPLYRNLIKMKIEDIGVRRVVNVDERGKMSINPLYKEIREYIKLIEQMWKSVGISGVMVSPPGDEGFHPDDNYYEEMEKGALTDIHEQRGAKLSLVRRTKE